MLVGLASCLTAGVAAVAQNRGIQLRSVEAKLEGTMDIQGILGIDSDVRNGYDDIKVTFKIDADASKKEIEALVAQSQKRSAVYDVDHQPDERDRRSRLSAARHRSGAQPSNASPRSSSAPGTPAWRRAAASRERSIDHVVLERGEVANSWRRERWDSLRLLTPNWQSRLPGYRYDGADPDGFMTMAEVVEFISRFAARRARAGAHAHRRSRRSTRADDGYHVATSSGELRLPQRRAGERRLQPAAACRRCAQAVPPSIAQPHAVRLPQSRRSCPKAACWSSARRPPACSWPTRSTAPAGR